MTCPGGFSCTSLEGFVNSMWPFAVVLAVSGVIILIRMFTGKREEKIEP